MSRLTPIINYDGPQEQKKDWVSRGTKLLEDLQILQPNLAIRDFTKKYPDGSSIRVHTTENEINRVDLIDIKVPTIDEGKKEEEMEVIIFPLIEAYDPSTMDLVGCYGARTFTTQLDPIIPTFMTINSEGKVDKFVGNISIKEIDRNNEDCLEFASSTGTGITTTTNEQSITFPDWWTCKY